MNRHKRSPTEMVQIPSDFAIGQSVLHAGTIGTVTGLRGEFVSYPDTGSTNIEVQVSRDTGESEWLHERHLTIVPPLIHGAIS